ncbi:MAG TPA: hypothetical protein VK249_09745 [Anaerolineales bacterium]|nr:hypothetical protein [Anaerolineales bacterium]
MNAPTTQPDKVTATELRQQISEIFGELEQLRADVIQLTEQIQAMRQGLQTAASRPAAQTAGQTITIPVTRIEREKRKGTYYYRMLGGPYTKHGIRVWPEVLEAMNLDKLEYDKQDEHRFNPALICLALVEEYESNGETKTGPQKIIGKAP